MAGDSSNPRATGSFMVSIHARAWRATATAECLPTAHKVSIHARAWRATAWDVRLSEGCVVSIHARAWRATGASARRLGLFSCFNPRPRMAGDLVEGLKVMQGEVSIHARAWRATMSTQNQFSADGFNPRPRMAGDTLLRGSQLLGRFQSTPAHGGRREGRLIALQDRYVSIHARAWRATPIIGLM